MSRRRYDPDDDLPPRDRPHKVTRRYPDHDYAGRTIFRDTPKGRKQPASGGHQPTVKPRALRPLPPALAPLVPRATPAEIDTAYQGDCPRGRGHTLHILHVGGRWRLFCTKGCSEGDILRAIGRPPDVLRYRPPAEPRAPTERSFEYLSPDGQRLFEVVRKLDVPTSAPGKDRFHLKLPDGRRLKAGGYTDAIKGLVYRLVEPQRAPVYEPVFWCEGEKDVESLRADGLVAVTTSIGAHGYKPEAARWFKGRAVVILPDNDEPGTMYADRVEKSLRGVAAKVNIVKLPGLPPKGDVSDWLANGGKVEDLLKAAQVPDFFKPVKAAPPAPKAARAEVRLGTVEATILTALDAAEHKSLSTDALPMRVTGLPGEEAWNARAKAPITRYPDVPKSELAKARAGISRALGSLVRRGLVEKTGRWVRLARSAPTRNATKGALIPVNLPRDGRD